MDMDKMENILYSLIPLVIIILISWMFSFLASKKRRQHDGSEEELPRSPRDQFLDFLSPENSEEEEIVARREIREDANSPHVDLNEWAPPIPTRGPEVTPKPIKPKWWGA